MQTKIEMGYMDHAKPSAAPVQHIKSLREFTKVLQNLGLDPELYNKVLETAKRYPEGSLNYFYANLNQFISKHTPQTTPSGPTYTTDKNTEETTAPSGKWSTVSANEINQARQQKKMQHRKEMQQEIQKVSKPLDPVEAISSPAFDKWTPGDDPELEEYRQKMNYLRKNHKKITEELEAKRKSLGESAPDPLEHLKGLT